MIGEGEILVIICMYKDKVGVVLVKLVVLKYVIEECYENVVDGGVLVL